MGFLRPFLYALAIVALAACGGGSGGGALPPAVSDPGALDPNGSSVAFEKATLWVGYNGPLINAFSTEGNGAVTPEKTLGYFPWPNVVGSIPGIVDIAVAPDGTQWVLEKRDFAQGGRGWRLFAVAPGASTTEYVNGDDVNSPFAVGLAGDGVMVGYFDSNGTPVIATYPYSTSNAPAMRTFRSTSPVRGFAEGNDGHLYIARADGFDVYDPTSTGCCPMRSFNTGALSGLGIGAQRFAVGPDNSIYTTDLPGNNANPVMYVNVYGPGSATLTRRIGPLPADYTGFGFPVITVDSKNRLYVATKGQFYRFGPNANGTTAPQRLMTDPTLGRPVAMAVGPKL
jgi:hypothetical protein